jgi:hypothetical protein
VSLQQPIKICFLLKTTSRTSVTAPTKTFLLPEQRRKTSFPSTHGHTHTYILHQGFSRISLVFHSHLRCPSPSSNLINPCFLVPSPSYSLPFSLLPSLSSLFSFLLPSPPSSQIHRDTRLCMKRASLRPGKQTLNPKTVHASLRGGAADAAGTPSKRQHPPGWHYTNNKHIPEYINLNIPAPCPLPPAPCPLPPAHRPGRWPKNSAASEPNKARKQMKKALRAVKRRTSGVLLLRMLLMAILLTQVFCRLQGAK